MDLQTFPVHLQIRRYDLCENPEIINKIISVSPNMDYDSLKNDIKHICDLTSDYKVIKIRNPDGILIPYSFLISMKEKFFYVDVSNINYVDKDGTNLLQDAYVDAVRQKMKSLESRIAQTELVLPQLEWRRQAYMEETVNGLLYKVAFLNRRFDELAPQFRSKVQTMS